MKYSRHTRSQINQSLETLEVRRLMATFNVSTPADNLSSEATVTGSLREAIQLANSTPGADVIQFTIPMNSSAKLELKQPLPAITEALTIDGATLPGYILSKRFEIARSNIAFTNFNALDVQAPSTIRGLSIIGATSSQSNFVTGNGIRLSTGSDGSTLEYNFIGLPNNQVTGTGNRLGVYIASNNNTLRGNVISGNQAGGVAIVGANNVISGNRIGTDSAGSVAKANSGDGVKFLAGAANNRVGGPATEDRNILSGNMTGVSFDGANDATILNNVVEGNYIGTNSAGVAAIPNNVGIGVGGGVDSVIKNNVISASVFSGVTFGTNKAVNTTLTGNRVGMNAAGTAALLNGEYAVNIPAGIDGLNLGAANEGNWFINGGGANKFVVNLGGNDDSNTSNVRLRGNVFGILPNGTLAGNAGYGIGGGGSVVDITVGGPQAADGNKFAGQSEYSLFFSEPSNKVSIQNNWFGLTLDGTAGLGTTKTSVSVVDPITVSGNKFARAQVLLQFDGGAEHDITNNTFGLNAAGNAVISGTSIGVFGVGYISESSITGNTFAGMTGVAIQMSGSPSIQGNRFGTDVTGMVGLTTHNGVQINGSNAYIGGSAAGAGNLFGKITQTAISVSDTTDVVVLGNTIGTNADRSAVFAGLGGVSASAVTNPTIGGSGAYDGNLIVGQTTAISVGNAATFSIQGNTLGLQGKANGVGIEISNVTAGVIGGDTAAAGNVITHNNGRGILFSSGVNPNVTVRRNTFHSNGGLAIDLKNDGILTPNDALDADAGTQNFPLLLSADSSAGNATSVMGLINTSASTPIILDFYAADVGTNSARIWLGSKTILTDNAGGASFTHNLPFIGGNKYIVATATNIAAFPNGSTSEFSPGVQVNGPIDNTVPTVSSGTFEFETAQRVTLTFSEELMASSISASDLQMKNTTTNTLFAPTSFTYDAATKRVGFAFNNQLTDGNYIWTLAAGSVDDLAGNMTTSPFTGTTHVLAGDLNRDKAVNFSDLLTLAQNYGSAGKTFSQGNINYDAQGKVDFSDLLMLAQRYGTTLFSVATISDTSNARSRARTVDGLI